MRYLLLACWLGVLPSLACGADYYVDTESRGGPCDDANPGSLEKPWRSLKRATRVEGPHPQAGDTIWVRGGTYTETVRLETGGTAEQPLKIKAFSGEQPAIDGEGQRGSGIVWAEDGNADHVVVEGLTLRNFRGEGIAVAVQRRAGVILRGLDVSGARLGVFFSRSSQCRLEGSEIHHCQKGNVWLDTGCSDIIVADNHIHHCLEGHSVNVYAPANAVHGEGAVASVEPDSSGLARFTTEELDLSKVRGGTLQGQDAHGSVKSPSVILLFPEPTPAPDGQPVPGGTVSLPDGRQWFALRNNPEWDGRPFSPDGRTGLFEVGKAEIDALARAKYVYVAYTFLSDVANRDIQILRNEVDHGAIQGIWAQRADGLFIKGNRTHHNGATGIQIESLCRRVWLDGNTSYANCTAYGHETGIWLDETIDAVVQNNSVYENQKGMGVTQCQWTLVRRNVIRDNRAQQVTKDKRGCQSNSGAFWYAGGRHYHLGAPPGAKHNAFVHNALYGNGTPESAWGGIQHGSLNHPAIGPNRFLNNLVQNTFGAHPIHVERVPVLLDGNIYHGTKPLQVLWREGEQQAEYDISEPQGFDKYKKATGQDAHSLLAKVDVVRTEQDDIHLVPGNVAVDRAQPLTSTTTAGAGTTVSVEDVSCFSAGYKTRVGEVLVRGDEIMIGDERARIKAIDRANSRLIVDRSMRWEMGTPVTYTYQGKGPDVGAFELE